MEEYFDSPERQDEFLAQAMKDCIADLSFVSTDTDQSIIWHAVTPIGVYTINKLEDSYDCHCDYAEIGSFRTLASAKKRVEQFHKSRILKCMV